MAVAAIDAAFNPLTIQVLVEFGIQNPLRQCLLQAVKRRPSFANTSFGSRPESNWSRSSFSIAM
jgi:hypothetical protein